MIVGYQTPERSATWRFWHWILQDYFSGLWVEGEEVGSAGSKA